MRLRKAGDKDQLSQGHKGGGERHVPGVDSAGRETTLGADSVEVRIRSFCGDPWVASVCLSSPTPSKSTQPLLVAQDNPLIPVSPGLSWAPKSLLMAKLLRCESLAKQGDF